MKRFFNFIFIMQVIPNLPFIMFAVFMHMYSAKDKNKAQIELVEKMTKTDLDERDEFLNEFYSIKIFDTVSILFYALLLLTIIF